MSKPNRSHINFCRERLDNHSNVESCDEVPDSTECILKVVRKDNSKTLIVHLASAYEYTLAEYLVRPEETNFVVLVPHSIAIDGDVAAQAKKDRVDIGHIRELMGALKGKF